MPKTPPVTMTIRFVDKDLGWRNIYRRIKAWGKPHVLVGVVGKRARQPHLDSSFAHASDLTLAQLAMIHEFGLGNVPERPFTRNAFDQNLFKLMALVNAQAAKAAFGRTTEAMALKRIGVVFQGMIRKTIANKVPPPLHPLTVKYKNASIRKRDKSGRMRKRKSRSPSTPLIHTGTLRAAIDFVVKGAK